VKSTLNHLIYAIYMRVLDNFDNFGANLEQCMQQCMDARSFRDPNAPPSDFGSQVISSLVVVFFE
jgi:hypothetical protein